MKTNIYSFNFWKTVRAQFNKNYQEEFICCASKTFCRQWESGNREHLRDLANKWVDPNRQIVMSNMLDDCLFYSKYEDRIPIRRDFIRAMCKKFKKKS